MGISLWYIRGEWITKKAHGLLMPPGRWDPEKISVLDVFCGGFALAELVARETK